MFRKLQYGMFPVVEDADVHVDQANKSHQLGSSMGKNHERHHDHEHHKVKAEFKLPDAFFKPGHGGKGTGGA